MPLGFAAALCCFARRRVFTLPPLSIQITYENVAEAKAAIDKYDGVDMGLGTTLELQAL